MGLISMAKSIRKANKYKLRRRGIKYPVTTVREAERAGISLSLACAVLSQESAGGHNVFGHDPVKPPQIKGGKVTKSRYLQYKKLRRTHGMQGVGPMQLTWYTFQDAADKLGGCWVPKYNMRIGFKILRDNIKKYGERDGIRRYNGSGEAAERYASQVLARKRAWHRLFIND